MGKYFTDVYIAIGRKKHSNQRGHLVTFVDVETDKIVFQLCRDPRKESTWRRVRKIARRHKWKIVKVLPKTIFETIPFNQTDETTFKYEREHELPHVE